ncbi:MAG: hypothetical protein M3Q42_05285 [Pseudomonadota bacterium]|nr:hypothetical protein [Pseudomonadota bacterium]
MKKFPRTPSQRTTASRARSLEAGAVRVDVILRDPEAISALEALAVRYGSRAEAVRQAVIALATLTALNDGACRASGQGTTPD